MDYADLAERESLYNLLGEPYFIGKLARNPACRELADMPRAALGMQLRLTPAGIDLAGERDREAFQPASWRCDGGTANRAQHTHAQDRTDSQSDDDKQRKPLASNQVGRRDAKRCETTRKKMAEVHGNRTHRSRVYRNSQRF